MTAGLWFLALIITACLGYIVGGCHEHWRDRERIADLTRQLRRAHIRECDDPILHDPFVQDLYGIPGKKP